jgi:hypothetical protein
MSDTINIDPEFVELADLSSPDLCEILIPRNDRDSEAHRRRLALEILMTRALQDGRRNYRRSLEEMESDWSRMDGEGLG